MKNGDAPAHPRIEQRQGRASRATAGTRDACLQDTYCFRYLEIGRLGVSESFWKFSPNLQNSEPPSSESKGGDCLISDIPRIYISNRVQNFNFPKSRLRWAGECGILFPSCLSKAR